MLIGMHDVQPTSQVERLLTEQAVGREIDLFVDSAREWNSAYGSGFNSIVGRFRGNPELQPLLDDAKALRDKATKADLAADAKARLVSRIEKAEALLKPADLKFYIGAAVVFVALKGITALSSTAAAVATEKAKQRFSRTRLGQKLGMKKSRQTRRRVVEDSEESLGEE
jgi:hypothetical protein